MLLLFKKKIGLSASFLGLLKLENLKCSLPWYWSQFLRGQDYQKISSHSIRGQRMTFILIAPSQLISFKTLFSICTLLFLGFLECFRKKVSKYLAFITDISSKFLRLTVKVNASSAHFRQTWNDAQTWLTVQLTK